MLIGGGLAGLFGGLLGGLLGGLCGDAHAQDRVIDGTRLLSLSSNEVLAMGGAGIGFAAGANGLFFQPGAPANRRAESHGALTGSLACNSLQIPDWAPADVSNLDSGRRWTGRMNNFALSGAFHNGGLGFGTSTVSYTGARVTGVISESHFVAGGSVWDGHVGFGAGGRLLSLDATVADEGTASYASSALETGFSLNRLWGGWNFGAVLRSSVLARENQGNLDLGIDGVAVPWQVAVGLGWQDAYAPRPRPVRVAADLVLDGPVENGIALETILDPQPQARGAAPTLTPHLGVEATAIPERLHLRAGTYLEPGRTLGAARAHATTGFELRLFHLDLFGLTSLDVSWEAALDLAPRYLNVGWLGIGLWQSGVVGTGWHPHTGR